MKIHSKPPRRWQWAACLLACLLGCRSAPAISPEAETAARTEREPAVAFVGVAVVPLDSEQVLEGQTVVVRGERIEALGPAASTPVPPGATRIEGRGRFLMPGLVDMHLHLQPGNGTVQDAAGQQLTLLLANGVTTARSLGGPPSGLLLLDANPLEDVKHTRAIAGVMTRGRWLPRSELDARLDAVANAVKPPPKPAP